MLPSENQTIEIKICLGSSCFARGNAANLEILRQHLKEAADDSLHLSGSLCQEQCKCGPNILVDSELHSGITASDLRELLQKFAAQSKEQHGTA